MILYPAIDLKNGACVRLVKGDMAAVTVFNTDPAAQALSFAEAGCQWIHVVDLDGAFAGQPVNGQAVDRILGAVTLPVQLGGGIRDLATIESWIKRGVARVILGTVALRDPALVRQACARFPGKVAVGIDARGGKVAVEGWAETSEVSAMDLALRFEDAGVCAIIYTDIDRDGLLSGPNIEATAQLAEGLTTPVIASGGVASLSDLLALKARASVGIQGVISGRALYDGRIDLKAALAALRDGR
ncbi:MAG TPA: 1-(5-phosphoribosyl)-5-[(5-phosphoribosylamino)methylideneamino]imidazole-4-carboxamide isomerase [Rhodospirillaceae bacterium]|nr:1-(5-phosphoribosyl)-5-[(5-phosphoribosylamino)methylideneamino]imidazole-4-carboxamide isomerase [Rhodospirillaceae bacterium]